MAEILIVEDEEPISNLIKMSLKKAGYQCITLSTDAFNPAWQKGYRYVYTLTLGERGISLQSVDIKGWTEVSEESSDVDPGWQ